LLVIAECALAVLLLAGAGLLIRSFMRVNAVDAGFRTRDVLLVRISPPPTAGRSTAEETFTRRMLTRHEIMDRLGGLPEVESVGATTSLMMNGNGDASITIPGRPRLTGGTGWTQLTEEGTAPGFFQTMGVPLLRGRLLDRADAAESIRLLWVKQTIDSAFTRRGAPAEPVVINQTFAARIFPGEDPIGKRFYEGEAQKPFWYEVVGVVGDMHRQGLETRVIPEYFHSQVGGNLDLVVRVQSNPGALAASIRALIRSVDRNAIVLSVSTVEERMAELTAKRRMQTGLLVAFAAVALVLAAVGIYGVMRYTVAERTHEIGIRVALGAGQRSVLAMVIGKGMTLAVIGMSLGVAAALALTRLLSRLLYDTAATDPATFVAVPLVLASVALIACYIPARNAAEVDPVVAIRHE
jgi:putative ABC transport system permease protein